MSEDDVLRDDEETPLSDEAILDDDLDEVEGDELDLGLEEKKKKDLIDEDTVSLDDEAEEELDTDPDEPFDDVYDN